MTEVIHGFHDTGGAIQFLRITGFSRCGKYQRVRLDVNEKGEPSLMEIKSDISGNE
jgi:hypothetical protein